MSFVKLATLLAILIIQRANSSFENSNGNIHVMKNEIEKAMEDCGDTKDSGETSRAEFERKSSSGPESSPGWYGGGPPRRARSVHPHWVERARHAADERRLDGSSSGEWDYGETGRDREDSGRSWDDPKDDRSVMDSVYSHSRRNNSYSYPGNNESSSSGAGKSVQEQNSTKYDQGGMNNNFDSRGARIHPSAGFGSLMDDRVYKTVRDLNRTTNYYDPFMTRGIRSAGPGQPRQRRYDRLTKTANEDECLSQCVFTNLQIVDDRGIPTEGLFIKLLQDSITSQQSRLMLEDQLTACFHELASAFLTYPPKRRRGDMSRILPDTANSKPKKFTAESEDNGCSYSNALDRCMGLEIRKRKSLLNENTNVTTKST